MTSFRRDGDTVVVAFDEVEASLLRHLVTEVSDLIAAEDEPGADPLEDLTGLVARPAAEPPDDPVLVRLLPDGYRDDPESAEEFRRLTESELRRSKRDAAARLLADLPGAGGGEVRLDPETTERWLTTLNDVRLALGTRLDITEDMDEPDQDDPDAPAYVVYVWLTQLQDVLVQLTLEE
jgi:Domain of unknown function (DUF2017)